MVKTSIVGKRPAGATSTSGRKPPKVVTEEPVVETTAESVPEKEKEKLPEPAADVSAATAPAVEAKTQLLSAIVGQTTSQTGQPAQEVAADANVEKHYFITITYENKKPKKQGWPQSKKICEISEFFGKKISKEEVFVLKLTTGEEVVGDSTVREAVALAEQAGTKEEPVQLVLEQDDW